MTAINPMDAQAAIESAGHKIGQIIHDLETSMECEVDQVEISSGWPAPTITLSVNGQLGD